MAGLTAAGFQAKRLPEIKAELEQSINDALGAQIDWSADTPDGQTSGVLAEARAALWALAESIYQSQYPSTASGVSLDRSVDLNGVTRLPATSTTCAEVVVFGDVGTVLSVGRLAQNAQTEDSYSLTEAVTISLTNAVRVRVEVGTVADSADYTITLGATAYTINSGIGATSASILTALQSALPVTVTTTLDGDLLVELDTPETISVSANLVVTEAGNLANFAAVETGRKLLPAGTLTVIETPVSGWSGVSNRTDGIAGTERETDEELRIRRAESIGISAQNTLEAITANLRQLSGVSSVTVRQNNGTVTDGDGIPPQHIWCIVSGGDQDEIAEVLFKTAAGGIGFKGDDVVNYFSSITETTYQIRFDRPTSVDVYISIDLTVDTSVFPTDGEDQIKDALVASAADIKSGDPLLFSRLYTAINSVPGHYVTDLRADTVTPPTATGNINVALNERISLAVERITINVTS